MTQTLTLPAAPISPLRQRLIEGMNMRRFAMATQRGYIRAVARFATFLGRPPDTAPPSGTFVRLPAPETLHVNG